MMPPDSIPVAALVAVVSSVLHGVAIAEDHRIALSAPWPAPESLAPGDRILLEPGLHDARAIRSWPGSAEAPIVITSADNDIPAGLAGLDGPALLARDCGGLRIERLLVIGEGLDLEGRGADSDSGIVLENVQFLPASREAGATGPATGVRIASCGRARVTGVGIQRWRETGIAIESVRDLEIRQPGLVGGPQSPVGLRLTNCRRAAVDGGGIVGAADAGVVVTVNDHGPSAVTIDRLVWQQCATPLRLAGDAEVTVSFGTIVAPTAAVVEFAPSTTHAADHAPTAASTSSAKVRMDRCLSTWVAGGLGQLFLDASGDDGTRPTLELGDNLWWSPELPIALETLGGFPDGSGRQQVDVDPRLVPRTWAPSSAAARPYGHAAPPPRTEPRE